MINAAGLCARVVWGWPLRLAFGGGVMAWLGSCVGGLGWAGVVGAHMGWAWGFWWVDTTFLHAYKDSDAATPLSHLYSLTLFSFL